MILAAVLGGDVSRSRSPAIHQAAFTALGIEGRYEAFSVEAHQFRTLVRRLSNEGYRYVNVTIPHKRAAATMTDSAGPLVQATRAANTLIFRPRRGARATIRGDNTDGYGLLTALGDLGAKIRSGKEVTLVGSGGAAAGGLAALLTAGARVRLVARRTTVARAMRRLFPLRAQARITVCAWTPAGLAEALEGASVLISAVPATAWASQEARAGLRALAPEAAVLEMAYGATTPLATAARGKAERYQDGLPMLVHQAARAVELALGKKPPAEPLLKAARGLVLGG